MSAVQILRHPCMQVINAINHSAGVRYPLMNPAKPSKVLERVATGADKIFVLVSCAILRI